MIEMLKELNSTAVSIVLEVRKNYLSGACRTVERELFDDILREPSRAQVIFDKLRGEHLERLGKITETDSKPESNKETLEKLFSEYLNKLLVAARNESTRTGYCFIGIDHLALGALHYADQEAEEVLLLAQIRPQEFVDQLRCNLIDSIQQARVASNLIDEEKLSVECIEIMHHAAKEAVMNGRDAIGTDQILAGYCKLRNDNLQQITGSSNFNLTSVREATRTISGVGDSFVSELSLTPRAFQILKSAHDIALANELNQTSPECLLLAIVNGEGMGSDAVSQLKLNKSDLVKRLKLEISKSVREQSS